MSENRISDHLCIRLLPLRRERVRGAAHDLVQGNLGGETLQREEAELQESQGERYTSYRKAVPRLWPSLRPRLASAGRQARWADGFKAESWYWGFPASVAAFAVSDADCGF